jgi:hypothetical protein
MSRDHGTKVSDGSKWHRCGYGRGRTEGSRNSAGKRQNAGDQCETNDRGGKQQRCARAQVLGWLIRHVALRPSE